MKEGLGQAWDELGIAFYDVRSAREREKKSALVWDATTHGTPLDSTFWATCDHSSISMPEFLSVIILTTDRYLIDTS